MTKDGIREKVTKDLHRLFDRYATPATPDELALLAKLK